MARWKAENFYKTPQTSSEPADVGTSCHFALEMFVKAVYLDKTISWEDVAFLNDMYKIGYTQTFGHTDYDTDSFKDGATLIAKWYERNKMGLPNKVLSCESKETFGIKTKAGIIPFTYIWDRFDQIDEGTFEVVDYKSIRLYHTPEMIKQKIQPRAYALAAQIKHPEAKRIYVSFDMLRHDGLVGAVFTRDENAATYRYLQRAVNRIIDTDEDAAEERLNDECKWCIRKVSCETLAKAGSFGSIFGLSTDELVERHWQVSSALLALKYAQEELDNAIMKEAEATDSFEWDTDKFHVSFGASKRRKSNDQAIVRIVGADVVAKYGGFSMASIDQMLSSSDLTPEQKAAVQKEITTTWSSPRPKITERKDVK